MRPVAVGVLGVGVWGEKHARVYHALPEAELVGVFDMDAAKAREVASRHGCRAFPPGTRAAIERGLRVLFREKRTVEDAVARLRELPEATPEVEHLARFAETSTRGLTR